MTVTSKSGMLEHITHSSSLTKGRQTSFWEPMHYKVDGPLQALFADFTVCPTEPFKQGHAQAAVVKRIEHAQISTLKK